jgi:hypothetical protein
MRNRTKIVEIYKKIVTIQPDPLDINLAINIRYTQKGRKDFRTGNKF